MSNKKELSQEELKKIAGGRPKNTVMKCKACDYSVVWVGDYMGKTFNCPSCAKYKFVGYKYS